MQISVKQGNLDVSDDLKQTIEDWQLAILILNSESSVPNWQKAGVYQWKSRHEFFMTQTASKNETNGNRFWC